MSSPPFRRRVVMSAIDDVDNSFDNSNSFDKSNNSFDKSNSFDAPDTSFSPGAAKQKVNIEDHANLGDDMDFLLNGGFEEMSKKEKKKTSSSKSKSKLNPKKSHKSSRNRSLKGNATSSSPDISMESSNDNLMSPSGKFDFGLEDLSNASMGLDKTSASPMNTSVGSVGDISVSVDSFGISKASNRRPSRKIVAIDQSDSQRRDSLESGAGGRAGGPVEIIDASPPHLEHNSDSLKSPSRREVDKIPSFDDDVTSMMSAHKILSAKTEGSDEEGEAFEFDEVPLAGLDEAENTESTDQPTDGYSTMISPRASTMKHQSPSSISSPTPRGKSSPSFDFGFDVDDKKEKEKEGEFDWMLPSGPRRGARTKRGSLLNKEKAQPGPAIDWLLEDNRPKRVVDPFAASSHNASVATKVFSFVDSDDSDDEEPISNSIWAAGKTKRVSTIDKENEKSDKEETEPSTTLSQPKALTPGDKERSAFQPPPTIVTSNLTGSDVQDNEGNETPVVGSPPQSPNALSDYSVEEFDSPSPVHNTSLVVNVKQSFPATNDQTTNSPLKMIEQPTSTPVISHRSPISSTTHSQGDEGKESSLNPTITQHSLLVQPPVSSALPTDTRESRENQAMSIPSNTGSTTVNSRSPYGLASSPPGLKTVHEKRSTDSLSSPVRSPMKSLKEIGHGVESKTMPMTVQAPIHSSTDGEGLSSNLYEQSSSLKESGVSLDSIAGIVKKSVEKAISTTRNQAMIDIANVRADCEVQVAELREKLEAAKETLRIEENKVKILESRAKADKEAALNELAKELNARHSDDVRRLKDVHLKELAAKDKSVGSEATLRSLAEEFHHSVGTLEIIKHQIESNKHGAHVTREAELDARERRIAEEMLVLKSAEVANEKKVAEVRALLHNLAEMQRTMRSDAYVDKQRLADESERLNRESECRERAAQARESSLLAERKALEKSQSEFEDNCRKQQVEVERKRKELDDLYTCLAKEKQGFEELKRAALSELEEREKGIAEKEAATEEVRRSVQEEALQLERQTKQAALEMNQLFNIKQEVEGAMLHVEEEKRRVRELGLKIEEASENVAARAADAEMKIDQAQELKAAAEESEARAAEHRFRVDGVVVDLEKQRLAIEQERSELLNAQRELREAKRQFEQEAKTLLLSDQRNPTLMDFHQLEQASQARRHESHQQAYQHWSTTSQHHPQFTQRVPLATISNHSHQDVLHPGEFEELRIQGTSRSKAIDSQVQFLRDIGAME